MGEFNPPSRERARFHPEPRMRFAAERFGRHLLVYGGHRGSGLWDVRLDSKALTLNLMTLEWNRASIRNRPHSFPAASASALNAGIITGGLQVAGFGMEPVPKFDIICLRPPAEHCQLQTSDEAEDESEPEEDEESLATVRATMADGTVRTILVPR